MSADQDTFDVVVVGAGLAGLTAALTAAEAGAHVALLEKGAEYGGSSSRSGGGMVFVCTDLQEKAGVEDSLDALRDDLMRASQGRAQPEIIDAYNNTGSHSGYNVVRHHLLELGETGGYFGRVVSGGTHQGSIRGILDGTIDTAGIDSTVLETEEAARPELRTALRTIAVIGPSPIPPVVVPRTLDPALRTRLRDLLLNMGADPAGRAVLAAGRMTRFVPVADADYDPIRAMARRAEATGFLTLR